MTKMIEVDVVAYERVEYRQRVKMTQDQYDEIDRVWDEEGEEEAGELLLDLIDRSDVCGADNPEILDMKIVEKVDA